MYQVITKNQVDQPTLEIKDIQYAGRIYTEYSFYGWGGGACEKGDSENFIKGLGESVAYMKKHCVYKPLN